MSSKVPMYKGAVFGKWTILGERKRRHKEGFIRYLVVCECGTIGKVPGVYLRNGGSASCGRCVKKSTHGMSRSVEYVCWHNMLQRCYNPRHPSYINYGGRGITVCSRWYQFSKFYKDMGPKPSPELSLERRNNGRGYRKSNCTWETRKRQNSNRRIKGI